MAKFAVGEIAIVTVSKIEEFPVGCEVEILAVYDPPLWGDCQYLVYEEFVSFRGVRQVWANDSCLKKKNPPEETTDWEEIEKISGWNPLKTPILA